MELSNCMLVCIISDKTLLVYIGHKGELYQIMGGKNGQINLSKIS